MARLDADKYAKIRAMVEDGKIPVGSFPHIQVIQFEIDAKALSKRDQKIVRLSIRGMSHTDIAKQVGLTRGRVSAILRSFFGGD